MTLDRTWLVAAARSEREAMGRTIQYTEPERWSRPSASEGWRLRDIVAHLASSDVIAAATLGGEGLSEVEEYFKSLGDGEIATVDGFNAFAVSKRAEVSFRSVVTEWGRAADLFLARCSEVSESDWGVRKVYWVEGEMRVAYLVQSRVMEWWLHGEDVRAGADLPSRREHNPAFCVNDLAIRMIPYGLSLAGLSFPGRSVKIELEATGGGSWHYGLAPKESPPPGKAPDALIEGRGYEFALLAGRRLTPQQCLAEGSVRVSGDEALAETILEHLRAFA